MKQKLNELKIWDFFASLLENERKRLHFILTNSSRSEGNNVLKVFDYLQIHYRDIREGNLSRGDLFRHLFGKVAFDLNRFNRPVSQLVQAIKNFWKGGYYEDHASGDLESDILGRLRLLEKLEQNHLDTDYEYEKKALEEIFARETIFEDRYRLLSLLYKTELAYHARKTPRSYRQELRDMRAATRKQFLLDNLRISASIANQNKIAGGYQAQSIPPSADYADTQGEPILLFFLLYIELEFREQAYCWDPLYALFKQLVPRLSPTLLGETAELLISYTSRRWNAGDDSYFRVLMEIYQLLIENGLIWHAKWNYGSHWQNYLFLLGYTRDAERAATVMVDERERMRDLLPESTVWLLNAIYAEYFGDKGEAYTHYRRCYDASRNKTEQAVSRSKRLILDYENPGKGLLPEDMNSYLSLLRRWSRNSESFLTHHNFVKILQKLSAAACEAPGSQKRLSNTRKCWAALDSMEQTCVPLLHKKWLCRQLEKLENEK